MQPRVPQHQILIEMANMIRQKMRSIVTDELMESIPGMEERLLRPDERALSPVSGIMKSLPPLG